MGFFPKVFKKSSKIKPLSTRLPEAGNAFVMLFGAVGMVGVLGASTMTIMKGPVKSMSEVTKKTIAENNMIATTKLALIVSSSDVATYDCDSDATLEPVEYGPDIPGFTGGGQVPALIGTTKQDPWGTDYAYCSWDYGTTINGGGCAGDRRLQGGANADQYVLAVISAGPDRTFQSSCVNYVNSSTPVVNKTPGSDDLILGYTEDDAYAMSGGLWNIKTGEPEIAEIKKNLEVQDSGGNVVFGVDSATDPTKPSIKVDYIQQLSQGSVEYLSNIKLGNSWLSGDGANEGLQVDNAGNVTGSNNITAGNRLMGDFIQNAANSGRITSAGALVGTSLNTGSGAISGGAISGTTGTFSNTLAANNGVSVDGQTVIDNGAGWHRMTGQTGWYNATYGGGMHMQDSSYIRTYNGKSLYAYSTINAPALYGYNVGGHYGVYGRSNANHGIYGLSESNNYGVYGQSTGSGYGVYGQSAGNYGIYGRTTSAGHGGVLGYTANASVYGILAHANAWSFYGNSNTYTAGYARSDNGVFTNRICNTSGNNCINQADIGTGGGGGAACGATGVSWGNCSGSLPNTPDGLTEIAYDSSCCSPGCSTCGGYTGQRSYTCQNGSWVAGSPNCSYCTRSGCCGCGCSGSCDGDDCDEASYDLIFVEEGGEEIKKKYLENKAKGILH